MSGLETAIRNALDRSDRADREIRARIYQSARQALDAGLRKQGVSDRLIVMQQHERLEVKIHEIEMEEIRRLSGPLPEPEPAIDPDPSLPEDMSTMPVEPPMVEVQSEQMVPAREMPVEGEARSGVSPAPSVMPAASGAPRPADDFGDFAVTRAESVEAQPQLQKTRGGKPARAPKLSKAAKTRRGQERTSSSDTMLDGPPERAAKPRRRRSFLSHLLTWFVTLAVVGGACWWFYQSGMVQSFIEEAMKAADQEGGSTQAGGQGRIAFDPRRGFSDDWMEIFVPSKVAELKPGAQARVDAVAASEGQAVRIVSAVPGEGGDVAVDVPVEVLREMAGKSSTVALTLQSGEDRSAQLSVRCDFGSLGSCSRHRFTATQEKLEALFRVSFERSLVPNRPGRLIFNSGIEGADRPVLLYSVRILPGQ
ncbi:hypothetical protein [Rhizobium terrae]|uniref:hypothetical protein n=1 Tax=Rhizobium terrae TaxID=2171756 RepID=UPI0013C30EA0|nr:hypothetical protein [Rhizobium terrae]